MPIYRLGNHTPHIDPQCWIAPNATVIGQVHLARNVSIWWNATLRGDKDLISIGENSNIQDGSVLHTDPGIHLNLGRDITVGHMVMLHGCTIGDGSLIGIGSILLNRSVIGKNSLVGANTLIPEGKIFPERVLIVGSAIVLSPLSRSVASLPGSAERYVQNWQRYQLELSPA